MKLSTKIILPIILISALLILLNGCFGVPADEQPGVTPPTYTVTYDGNGNTGGVVPVDANLYEEGASVTVLDKGTLFKTGFDFDGWNTVADGSGEDYFPPPVGDILIMGTANVTLYAQWTRPPGYGPGPTPTPAPADPCAGNTAPDITDPSEDETIPANEGEEFTYEVKADDDPTQTLTFTLDQDSLDRGMTIGTNNGIITWPSPICDCLFLLEVNGNNHAVSMGARVSNGILVPCTCSYEVTVTVEDPCEFTDTVTFNVEVTCTTYDLTMAVSPTEGGSTNPPVGTYTYLAGTVVLGIEAIPANACWEFDQWSGAVTGSVNPTSVTMNADKVVTANFVKKTHTIIATAGSGGSISPSGDVIVDCGTDKTFTITPDSVFYEIQDVLVDTSSVGKVSSYTFLNVTDGHTIEATFNLKGPVYNQDIPRHYGTIGEAMVDNDADPGDTILVMAGTYPEVVIVDESLTLLGANAGVCAGVFPGTRGAESIVDAFKILVNDVTIDGFQINGADISADVLNAIVLVGGTSGHTISNNILPGPSGTDPPIANTRGIVFGYYVSNVIVACNEIYGWMSGTYINPSSDLLFQYNHIHHNWAGIGSDGLSDVSILNNGFNYNVEGFGSSEVGTNVEVHYNGFTDNGAGVNWYGPDIGNNIDATNNWWGDSTGPFHLVTNPDGEGDTVSTNVDYIPWLH